MALLNYLQPDVTRADLDTALDTMIKAQTAYDDARSRWADYHPVCVALAAELAQARVEHQRVSKLYFRERRNR